MGIARQIVREIKRDNRNTGMSRMSMKSIAKWCKHKDLLSCVLGSLKKKKRSNYFILLASLSRIVNTLYKSYSKGIARQTSSTTISPKTPKNKCAASQL
jgi:hypothetical protein